MEKKQTWSDEYSKSSPVGFMLRETYPNRWLRIHSLEKSKRYADSRTEEKELLFRHSESAKHVLDTNNLMLFISIYDDTPEAPLNGPNWLEHFNFRAFESINIAEDDEDDPYYLVTYGAEFNWDEPLFQKIILDVAKENVGPVAFLSKDSKGVFAPYDGGADLFYINEDKKLEAKTSFKTWISAREDGL